MCVCQKPSTVLKDRVCVCLRVHERVTLAGGRGGPAGRPYAPLSLRFSLNGQGSFACGSDLAGGLCPPPGPNMRDTGGGCRGESYSQNATNKFNPIYQNSLHLQVTFSMCKRECIRAVSEETY